MIKNDFISNASSLCPPSKHEEAENMKPGLSSSLLKYTSFYLKTVVLFHKYGALGNNSLVFSSHKGQYTKQAKKFTLEWHLFEHNNRINHLVTKYMVLCSLDIKKKAF